MALLESAIGGVAVTVIEQAINATGWAVPTKFEAHIKTLRPSKRH
jgi:hypothetical protein